MISIIIPTYNEEKYLPNLLSSIKKQIFTDYEVIIADNNSTDRTLDIAKEFGAKITSGGLPGKGRNEGAKIANGNLFLFLDADVILRDKYFLLDCYREFLRAEAGVATCYIEPLSDSKIDIIVHRMYNHVMFLGQKLSPYAPGFCIFASRSIHESINGFDETVLLGEDTDYIKRANKISKFEILKSHNILVSVRRLDRDGRLTILFKYLASATYMALIGPVRTNIFNYTFGHDKNSND